MKQEDVKFVRAIAVKINPVYVDVVGTDSYERSRLLSLLVEAEAMRKKAEFAAMCKDPRAKYSDAGYSDADWIANQKKEWGI